MDLECRASLILSVPLVPKEGYNLDVTGFFGGQNSIKFDYSVVASNIFYFHPYSGKIPILTNIFQMGWFNHQADYDLEDHSS